MFRLLVDGIEGSGWEYVAPVQIIQRPGPATLLHALTHTFSYAYVNVFHDHIPYSLCCVRLLLDKDLCLDVLKQIYCLKSANVPNQETLLSCTLIVRICNSYTIVCLPV